MAYRSETGLSWKSEQKLLQAPRASLRGQVYSYFMQASDADGDPLTFAIAQGSPGSFNTTTPNLFSFTPGFGSSSPSIIVSDSNGNTATQSWTVSRAGTSRSKPLQHKPACHYGED